MASRTSNFCIDSIDPYAQVKWWALVSADFRLLDEAEMGPDEEECWLVGPDDRRQGPDKGWAVLADPEGN